MRLAVHEEDSMRARFRRHLAPLAALGVAFAAECHRAPPPLAPPPAGVAPEAVLLRIHGLVGQSRHIRVATVNFMHFGPGEPPSGDSARPTMRMIQFATESVTAVSGDTMTVALVTDSSRMEMPGLNVPGAMLDSLNSLSLTMTTRMDSRGRVLSFEMKGSPRLNAQMASIRRMLPGSDTPGEAARGTFTRLPDRPVRVGETWADTSSLPRALGGPGGAVVATCRLERIETRAGRRVAVISSDMVTPPMALDRPMRVSSGPMHTVGEVQLDLGAGWIVSRSMTMTGSTHTEMGDVSMRMVMRQTPLEEGP
jgi:hypothetical protein